MAASNVISFETFRSDRNRRRSEGPGDKLVALVARPIQDRLATVLLSPRQIAHRRAMLDFASQPRERPGVPLTTFARERG